MVTPLYAAIITVLFLCLSFRALLLRRKYDIAVGTGGNIELEKALAAHANCAEYAPLALLMIYFLEQMTGPTAAVHTLCAALIVGRAVHAYGVSQVDEDTRLRVAGMVLTLGCLISAATRLISVYAG